MTKGPSFNKLFIMILSSSMILLLNLLNTCSAEQILYELKDLEVLEKEKNYDEFLTHVNDIRPSERSRHWQDMLQNMAVGLIDYKIKTKDYSNPTYRFIEQLAHSSALKTDQYFQLKYSYYSKKYFAECFNKAENKNLCENQLSSFWYFSKKDPDLGLDLAVILETNHSTLNTWPFYQEAIKDSLADFYCKKPNIQQAIIKKFYTETFSSNFGGNYKLLTERLISDKCFEQIIEPLKESLTSIKSTGLDKELALNILESRGKLSADDLDLYSILYLLDGPVVGDKMNIAWKKIEYLGENFKKRANLLERIQKLEIIPDKIFKDPTLPRHKAIINLFAKNFPEYLNYYGSTCVKFINNTSDETLNVSSSFQCIQFLKAATINSKEDQGKDLPWISDSVKSQYSSIKK